MENNFTQIFSDQNKKNQAFNKYAYIFFILISIILFVFSIDWMIAVSNLGIALAFDPFDQQIKWQNRPLYQRIWLFVHVATVFILFGVGIYIKHN